MIQHFGTLPPFAPLDLPSRAPFPRAQASCWVSRCLPGLVAAPAPQSCSMLLYTKCLTRQALFALPWMAELHAQCHTQALRNCCLAVPACARGGMEAYFALASLPTHPPSGLQTQFCLCTPFPACWAAGGSGGEARTPTHARRMHGRQKRAIRADPPSVTRPGVDRRVVVAGSGAACIRCAPRMSQHHARVLAGAHRLARRASTPNDRVPVPFLRLSPCTSTP